MKSCLGKKAVRFQDLEQYTNEDVTEALGRNDPEELELVSVTLAITSPDQHFAEDVCLKLALHEHNKVRGNAVMSLGHLARRFRQLNEGAVKPIVEAALQEPDDYVRVRAKSAADEIHQFLGWNIAGHIYG